MVIGIRVTRVSLNEVVIRQEDEDETQEWQG